MTKCAAVTARFVLIAGLVVSGACASGRTAGPAPPSPFPRAPQPPASTGDVPIAPPLRNAGGTGGVTTAGTATGAGIVQTALSLLGVAYRYGGADPSTGLDCSGLVWWVFGQHQIEVPRTVDLQYGTGSRINGTTLEAGDLIFFTTTGPGATHVGIALGPDNPGEFVHAPSSSGVVRVERYDSRYWHDRIVGFRRLVHVTK